MGRRPDPEIIEADQAWEPIRPDHGYRVGARIGMRDAGRARLAGAVAIGIVLAGMAFAAIGPLLPATPYTYQPLATRSAAPVAAALPDRAILGLPAPGRPMPVYAGGLRWLDPATGMMSGDPYAAPRTGLFVDGEGRGLCVCLEIPWSQSGLMARVTLRRYDEVGIEVARTTLYELQSVEQDVFGDPIQVDAEIAPDGRYLWLAHAVRAADSWQIGVDRVDLATFAVDASFDLEPVPLPAPGAADPVLGPSPDGWITQARSALRASLRISPDGRLLSVLVSVESRPEHARVPAFQQARFVIPSNLSSGAAAKVVVPIHDASDDPCESELSAWATNRDFVTICSRSAGNGVQPYVRIESAADRVEEVAVGPPVGTNDSEWLLDTKAGALYRWSSLAHVFTRFDIVTGTLATLAIDRTQVGTGDRRAWSTAAAGPVSPWRPLAGDDLSLRPPRLVGSADGSLIYALGFRSVADDIRDDRIASTGIWVFDAERVELVAHWTQAALYDEIGFTPGQQHLVTMALPGVDGDGAPTDWSASAWFLDPRTGSIVEILGDVVEANGFRPAILDPNAQRGIAGF